MQGLKDLKDTVIYKSKTSYRRRGLKTLLFCMKIQPENQNAYLKPIAFSVKSAKVLRIIWIAPKDSGS